MHVQGSVWDSLPQYDRYLWVPKEHTGGSRDLPLPHPTWADGDTTRCSEANSGLWTKNTGSGGSEQAAWESPDAILGETLGIGINLSAKREWDTDSTIQYKMTDGANWLCGVDGKPLPASKVAQYSKAKQRSCAYQTPVVTNVKKNAAPETAFNNYAKSTSRGWTGGDSTYSTLLPDGRRLWMFSDTFIGPLNSNGTRPLSAPLINQSFVVQSGNSMSTITGGSTSDPQALRPPPAANEWYWLGDGTIGEADGKERLQIVFHRWERFAPYGVWDIRLAGIEVSTFDLNNLSTPISSKNCPTSLLTSSGVRDLASVTKRRRIHLHLRRAGCPGQQVDESRTRQGAGSVQCESLDVLRPRKEVVVDR
ncbi:hypothetical protein SHKM778_27390 [Streptomyces sp. KM77-8]|uniref:Uncharacterized protein n=1 Tax=Streptomyces haneummycinicus TaxID=3074435 RepID=A0AAT9HGC7_9ACTN